MFNKFLALIVLLACGTAYGADETKTYKLDTFKGIDLDGGYDVELTVGKEQLVTATSSKETLDRLKVRVSGGVLEVDIKSKGWFSDNDDVKLVIQMKELNSLEVSGSADLEAKGIHGSKLNIDISGSGEFDLEGTIDALEIKISGSGEVEAEKLKAKTAVVKISGSGEVELNVTDSLDSKISGSGEIKYRGSPNTVNVNVSGSGKVKKVGK